MTYYITTKKDAELLIKFGVNKSYLLPFSPTEFIIESQHVVDAENNGSFQVSEVNPAYGDDNYTIKISSNSVLTKKATGKGKSQKQYVIDKAVSGITNQILELTKEFATQIKSNIKMCAGNGLNNDMPVINKKVFSIVFNTHFLTSDSNRITHIWGKSLNSDSRYSIYKYSGIGIPIICSEGHVVAEIFKNSLYVKLPNIYTSSMDRFVFIYKRILEEAAIILNGKGDKAITQKIAEVKRDNLKQSFITYKDIFRKNNEVEISNIKDDISYNKNNVRKLLRDLAANHRRVTDSELKLKNLQKHTGTPVKRLEADYRALKNMDNIRDFDVTPKAIVILTDMLLKNHGTEGEHL